MNQSLQFEQNKSIALRIVRKRLKELNTEKLEKFILKHGGLIFHEVAFNRIVSESFNTELSYFIAYNNSNKIIGICPLHTVKKELLKLTYSNPAIFEVPYGGWVFDKSEVSINKLINKMKIGLNESLIYWSNIQIKENFYKCDNSNTSHQTAIVDLSLGEDIILNNVINSKIRNMIRNAIKS